MKYVDFLLCIEVKNRETLPLLLLKYELEKRGYSVGIEFSIRLRGAIGKKYHTKVVVANGIRYYPNVHGHLGKSSFEKIVNLKWEQLGAADAQLQKDPPTDKVFSNAVANAWGEGLVNYIMKWVALPRERVYICGHPAMDFCRLEMKGFFLSRSIIANKYNLDEKKEWNIFISSFGFISQRREIVEKWDKERGNDYSIRIRESEKESMPVILEWFERIIEDKEGQIIIYRPHPTEVLVPELLKLKDKYNNFHIIREEDIKQWMWVSDRILSWFSTSTVEAYFMKKKVYTLRPTTVDEDIDNKIFVDKSGFIKSYDSFKRIFEDDTIQYKYPFDEEFINKYYYTENRRASELLADMCEIVFKGEEFELSEECLSDIEKHRRMEASNKSIKSKLKEIIQGTDIYLQYQKIVNKKTGQSTLSKRDMRKLQNRLYKHMDSLTCEKQSG